MKRYGVEWKNDGEGWRAYVGDRFEVMTWRFSTIHQCKVFVNYPSAKARRLGRDGVGIGLTPQKSRDAAMKHGLRWIEKYTAAGPQTPEMLFADCYDRYRLIYRTRLDVIEHLFYVIGNGYDWLDGAVVSTSPEDYLREREPDPWGMTYPETVGPLPDDGHPRMFYPVSADYALMFGVPDDVRPEWFDVAYEAAVTLRDRSLPFQIDSGGKYPSPNPEMGRQAVESLTQRFPQWIDRAVNALPKVPEPVGENPHDPEVRRAREDAGLGDELFDFLTRRK